MIKGNTIIKDIFFPQLALKNMYFDVEMGCFLDMLEPLIENDCVLYSMDMEGTLPTPEPGEQKKETTMEPGEQKKEDTLEPVEQKKETTPEPGEQKKAPVKPDPILVTENMKLKVENHGVFSCAPAHSSATSFLAGTLNISYTGTNRFVNCPKILVDTGSLVPSGIAISDKFVLPTSRGGELDKLSP